MTISPAIASMRRLLGDDAVDEWLHQHRFAHKERELMQRIAELEEQRNIWCEDCKKAWAQRDGAIARYEAAEARLKALGGDDE